MQQQQQPSAFDAVPRFSAALSRPQSFSLRQSYRKEEMQLAVPLPKGRRIRALLYHYAVSRMVTVFAAKLPYLGLGPQVFGYM